MSPEEETGLGEHASAWDVVEDPYRDPEGFWTVKQEATGSASQKLPLWQVMGKKRSRAGLKRHTRTRL